MMNRCLQKRQGNLMLLCLTLLSVFPIALFALGCEPGGYSIIENQRNEAIRIYITLIRSDYPYLDPSEETDYGVIPARTTKELAHPITFPRRYWVYRIQAKDSTGTIVFSHDYNLDDLEKIHWKIVIPPLSIR
ncbi:hypothetical protein ACFLT4_00595 [Chloroflexota bacterium]